MPTPNQPKSNRAKPRPDRAPQINLEDANILIVAAHPDDEQYFASMIFRATHDFNAKVDMVLITDGEKGFRYSDLGAQIYGKNLTNPDVAATELAAIRRKEMARAGEVLNMRDLHFLGVKDGGYTTEISKVLTSGVWGEEDVKKINGFLSSLLKEKRYDYVLVVLPEDGQHGAHKAATILALQAVNQLKEKDRPLVLGGILAKDCYPPRNLSASKLKTMPKANRDKLQADYPQLFYNKKGIEGYPETKVASRGHDLKFNRNFGSGRNGAQNYTFPAIWDMAQHVSQGGSQYIPKEKLCEAYDVLNRVSLPPLKASELWEQFVKLNVLPPRKPGQEVPRFLPPKEE